MVLERVTKGGVVVHELLELSLEGVELRAGHHGFRRDGLAGKRDAADLFPSLAVVEREEPGARAIAVIDRDRDAANLTGWQIVHEIRPEPRDVPHVEHVAWVCDPDPQLVPDKPCPLPYRSALVPVIETDCRLSCPIRHGEDVDASPLAREGAGGKSVGAHMKSLFVLIGTLLILATGGRWLKDQFTGGNYWAFAWWMAGVGALAWLVMHDHEREEIKDAVRALLRRPPGDGDR